MRLSKHHGLGNDFLVVLDERNDVAPVVDGSMATWEKISAPGGVARPVSNIRLASRRFVRVGGWEMCRIGMSGGAIWCTGERRLSSSFMERECIQHRLCVCCPA